MECQAVQAQLSAWLDDELSEAAGARLSAHLEGCEACRTEWRKLTALDAALSNLSAPVPPGLAEKVAAQVRRPHRRPGWQAGPGRLPGPGRRPGRHRGPDFLSRGDAHRDRGGSRHLEDFHDFPQGSLGAVVVSYQPEDGNGTHP